MVYGTITDANFLHIPYDLFKSGKIIQRISVKLYVADMSGVSKSVVRSLYFKLLKCVDIKIYRDMERVGIILSVRYTFYLAKTLLVHLYETPGESLCRCCEQREIKTCTFGFLVHSCSHTGYYLKSELCGKIIRYGCQSRLIEF